ncbi:LysE family translocator [Novosphingobium sp. AP12]|uniref:LysE family translocator n=1 Tax=Novosphingobium sp. AP12 TaxID=1144305 RepID=UPI00350F2C88
MRAFPLWTLNMTIQAWFLYLATATLLTMTPGLDTVMVLRTSGAEGFRNGALAALGIGCGCLCWGSATALGLGALLAASPAAFMALKLFGAAYLAWLGVNFLMHPRGSVEAIPAGAEDASGARAFRRGFSTNILNPKVGIFYLTLLPQFVPHGAVSAWLSLQLAGAHVAIALCWFIILAGLAGTVGPYLRRPQIVRWVDRATGGVFVGFGIQLTLGR